MFIFTSIPRDVLMKLLTRRFASSSCFLSVAYSTAHAQSPRLQRIEATAAKVPVAMREKPLRLGLADLLKAYNVPGLRSRSSRNTRSWKQRAMAC